MQTEDLRRKPRPLLGCVLGLFGGVFLSLLALIIYGIRGPGVFDRLGVSLGSALALYMVAGSLGGTMLGIMLPLTVERWGAVLTGIVAAVPLYLGASILLGHEDLYSGAIAAIIVGGVVGFASWEPPSDARRASDTSSQATQGESDKPGPSHEG